MPISVNNMLTAMRFHISIVQTALAVFAVAWVLASTPRPVAAAEQGRLPADAAAVLENLLDRTRTQNGDGFDPRCLSPYIDFILSEKPTDTIYRAGSGFNAPSAYHDFRIDADLRRLIDYSLSADIPSFFLWPSSLRLAQWTRVEGGRERFDRLQAAAKQLTEPFILKGAEHVTITPDQHTGAYYSYDVDKLVILAPLGRGMALISIYSQQAPSEVGRKGWVLGEDDDWSYLYTPETGLNVSGLGWARTYMYDSFGVNVYYQPDLDTPEIVCGVISWVKAGWAGINMVQPKHIHHGLVRVAKAFKEILEDPHLPDPNMLAKTFSQSKDLSIATLKSYAGNYFDSLAERVATSESLYKKLGGLLDTQSLLARMSREEMYAVLAKDYFKKLLDRNPVMDAHPF